MNIASPLERSRLWSELDAHIGRHVEKAFDWDAFPSNRGFPDLARAQMRYIGSGGSPKAGDTSTMKPEHFTLSLVHQPVGKYAACHAHEIEEAFLILDGVLTVGWEKDGEVLEVRLGPKDMILNARDVPHGFRNDGVDPVLMSIMVGVGVPLPPRYLYHPKNTDAALAVAFGAQPGKTVPFSRNGADHPLQELMSHYVVRHTEQKMETVAAGFGRRIYVGEGGAPASTARKEMFELPPGIGVEPYRRDVEEAYLVLQGCVTVGWEENGEVAEARLGPKDVVMTPAGTAHYFRNDGHGLAEMFVVIGTPHADDVHYVQTAPEPSGGRR